MPVLRGVLAAAPLAPGVPAGRVRDHRDAWRRRHGEVYVRAIRASDAMSPSSCCRRCSLAIPDRRARSNANRALLAALNHPHIAAIHSVEEIDGRLALILELVEGGAADRLATGPIRLPRRCRSPSTRRGSRGGSSKGVVHRDLKPSNVKITSDGAVKLLDFGLAKATPTAIHEGDAQLRSADADPTHDGVILGTGAYMSPEQARGQRSTKRDVWAFGCVLYEMLTGRRAFSGETISDTIAAILDREPDWTAASSASAGSAALVRRCRCRRTPAAGSTTSRMHASRSTRRWTPRARQLPHRRARCGAGCSRFLSVTLIVAGLVLPLVAWRLGLLRLINPARPH